MLKIAVVDDVQAVCSKIEIFLLKLADKYQLDIEVEPYYHGKKLCAALDKGENYDLIFLDIELPDISGIEICRYIRHTMEDDLQMLVFISAKKQYSLELHAFHPLDFLVKEISEADVERVFKLFMKMIGVWKSCFECRRGKDVYKIKIKDIKYLTVLNRSVFVVLHDDSTIEYNGTLEQSYREQLQMFDFLFVHKQYVVNPAYVALYEYDQMILEDGTVIPIGSSRRKTIRALQMKSAGKKGGR